MLINTVVFSIIGVVIVIVLLFALIIIIKNMGPGFLKCCCKDSSEPKKNQVVTISKNTHDNKKEGTASGKQYLTLEEHLDTILDTPIRKKSDKKETHGYTLEFFPDDNTVVPQSICGTQAGLVTAVGDGGSKTICSRVAPFRLVFSSDTFEMSLAANDEGTGGGVGFKLRYFQTTC